MLRNNLRTYATWAGAGVLLVAAAHVGPARGAAADSPAAPSGVHVVAATGSQIALAWTASAGATGYRLYRSGVVIDHSAATRATWTGLNCSSRYRLSVQAYGATGDSRRVDVWAATAACSARDTRPPSPPRKLLVARVAHALRLSWRAATDNVGVVGYSVYVNGSRIGSTRGTRFTVTRLSCGKRYRLAADAYDAAGNRSVRVSRAAAAPSCGTPVPQPTPKPPAPAPAPPPTGPSLYLSPTGSDTGPCTQAAPCRSFDRAYHLATPGTTVLLASGDYRGQSLTYNGAMVQASAAVVFRPAPGAKPYISDELSLRANPGSPIANVEFDDFAIGDIYVRYSQHLVFRNIDETYFFIRSSDSVSFLGGSSGGDHYGNSDTIGSLGGGTPASTNILVDGVTFHDFNNDRSPGTHDECMFIQESSGVTIRNSTFTNCRDFDIYANVLFGGSISGVTISGNHFGKTEPVGYYAFRANVGSFVFRNNRWDQGMSNDSPVQVSGCGNTLSSSGLPMPSLLRRPC